MNKIFGFGTGEIDFNPANIFFTTLLLSLIVFFIFGFQVAKWLLVDDFIFPSFFTITITIVSLGMLIHYGKKFIKMSK